MVRRAGDQLADAEKTARLVQLLASGASLEQARLQLGLPVHEARRLKSEALREIAQEAVGDLEALLGQELTTLELLQVAAMKEALKGSKPHIDSALRIMDHRAKLVGLYRPEVIEVRVKAVDEALEKVVQIIDGEVEVAPLRRAVPPGAA